MLSEYDEAVARGDNRFQAERAIGRELTKITREYNLTPAELNELVANNLAKMLRAARREEERE